MINPINLRNIVARELNTHKGIKKIWVSGGVDSMVLLDSLKYRRDIEIIHFHHGANFNFDYRTRCFNLVRNTCLEFRLPFKWFIYEGDESSETSLRNFRLSKIETGDKIVTAHHADDLFETRFIRLVRGSPVDSLDVVSSSLKIMPLQFFTKKEIREYAELCDVQYLDDPTNYENDNLRNYIRNEMIPSLNKFHPNFQKNMGETLNKIVEGIQ
jgi:tRNA(Ile)-lysidine synthase